MKLFDIITPEMIINTVICDICNTDYSELSDKGGMLVGSYALCPICAGKHKGKADDYANKGEAFKDFVLRIR